MRGTDNDRLAGFYKRTDSKHNESSVWLKRDNEKIYKISREYDSDENDLIWALHDDSVEANIVLHLWARGGDTVPRDGWWQFNDETGWELSGDVKITIQTSQVRDLNTPLSYPYCT